MQDEGDLIYTASSFQSCLTAFVLCREGPWQRCWASANYKILKRGSAIAAALICFVVFLTGFGGLLAAWSGYFVPTGPEDFGNTILFTLLANSKGAVTPTVRHCQLVSDLSDKMRSTCRLLHCDKHNNSQA